MIEATLTECLDFAGSFAFCMSGATLGKSRRMDVFGIYVLAVVNGFGGGVLRDVILGNHVPFLFRTPLCWGIAFLATILVFIPYMTRRKLIPLFMQIFDAAGLAFFTVVGVKAGLEKELHPYQCVIMGVLTSCFGGVIRDIIVNKIPMIFHREIYASLSLGGGILFFLMQIFVPNPALDFITIGVIFVARLLVVRRQWHLPRANR